MNMPHLRNLLASASKQELKFVETKPGGRGAYDFSYDPTLELYVDGYTITLADYWCGGNVEGECYRLHIECDDFCCRLYQMDIVSRRLVAKIPVESEADILASIQA